MHNINFSHDWNGKLSGPSVFTTIRRRKDYGHIEAGTRISINLDGKDIFPADVLGVSRLALPKANYLTKDLGLVLMLDTGLPTPNRALETIESLTGGDRDLVIIILRRSETSLFD